MSQAAAPIPQGDPVAERLVALTRGFSIEITPRELDQDPALPDVLPAGTTVYVTYVTTAGFEGTVRATRLLAAAGMRPVPHIAARALRDPAELDTLLSDLGGVEHVLVIAGSIAEAAGPYAATMDVLRSGQLQRHGIRRVDVAGHPEGSPDVDDAALAQAVTDKNAYARDSGLDLQLVTQFCFAPEPVVDWERASRAAGNRLPVHVGVPGAASAATLVKFGIRCGVGPSLTVLRKQAGTVLKLASAKPQYPDSTMLGVARAALDAASRFAAFHFFPFGAVERTAAWATRIADGRFVLDHDADRILLD